MGFLHGVSHRGIIEAYYSLHQARGQAHSQRAP
jgi:hypothetical protein